MTMQRMTDRALGLAVVLAVVAPIPALAAPPASSDQIVCDLTGECGSRDKPATRGFSIIHSGTGSAPATQGHHRAKPAAVVKPRGQVGHSNLAIAFAEGSATLLPAGKRAADEFAKALQSPALSGKRFLIAGHTSAVGGRAYNQDLSERRAAAVVDYLVGAGAQRTLFDVKGFGFDQPLPGKPASSPANRRVEVIAQ